MKGEVRGWEVEVWVKGEVRGWEVEVWVKGEVWGEGRFYLCDNNIIVIRCNSS